MNGIELAAFSGAFAGSMMFVVFLIAFIAIAIFVSELDNFFAGAVTLIAGFAIMDWWFAIPVWATLLANPMMLVASIAVYVAIGSTVTRLWSWPNFIEEHAEGIRRSYENWSMDRARSKQSTDFEEYLNSDSYGYPAWRHKNKLSSWVLMWPFVVAWDASHRPFIWVYNQVHDLLGEMFERDSKRIARKIMKQK